MATLPTPTLSLASAAMDRAAPARTVGGIVRAIVGGCVSAWVAATTDTFDDASAALPLKSVACAPMTNAVPATAFAGTVKSVSYGGTENVAIVELFAVRTTDCTPALSCAEATR